jgi:hypothetical protein
VQVDALGSYAFRKGKTIVSCQSLTHLVRRLGYEIALDMIEGRPDLLWLHAASAELGGHAVALVAESGRGKSTVVTALCERGWSYMSDDITPLDPATGLLIPFALTPEVRRHPGVELPADRVRNLTKAEVPLPFESVCKRPVPIAGLIFPRYEPGASARLRPFSAAEAALELLPCCLNFVRHREAAVRYVCELVGRLPVLRLSFSDGHDAAELLRERYQQWLQPATSEQPLAERSCVPG